MNHHDEIFADCVIIFLVVFYLLYVIYQIYTRASAEVDPAIVASLPDVNHCVETLKREFGVEVQKSLCFI